MDHGVTLVISPLIILRLVYKQLKSNKFGSSKTLGEKPGEKKDLSVWLKETLAEFAELQVIQTNDEFNRFKKYG